MMTPDTPASPTSPPSGLGALRNATVFIAVVLALSLVRFFHEILSPLIVAIFLMLLIDAVARVMHRRLPWAPDWVRAGIAGAVIIISFGAVGGLFVLEAPSFAFEVRALGPKLDGALARLMLAVGAPPITISQMFRGVDPGKLVSGILTTARGLISYAALVAIYFGFLLASRTMFGRKVDGLYDTDHQRAGARRVLASIRNAVERYVRLQTIKASMIAVAAYVLTTAMGVHDALFVSFLVFLSAFVPVVGAFVGAIFPSLLALSQFDDLSRPIILGGILGSAVFLIDNIVMPKLQSDEMNLDPLFVLISIGLWGSILGAPGVLLSTPLTVTVMAIAAEFEGSRWLAVLLSRDGHPIKTGTEA
jgi:predicted PurR-regulated permease PerM